MLDGFGGFIIKNLVLRISSHVMFLAQGQLSQKAQGQLLQGRWNCRGLGGSGLG